MSFRSCSEVLEEVRRTIASELAGVRRAEGGRALSLLDIGCWDGAATAEYASVLGGPAAGAEVYPEPARQARALGIDVREFDLETSPFPWDTGAFDVVVVNQVFEHLKNVWLPISEIARVLRVGGYLVFSVPNLASLHNRVLMAIGRQPTTTRVFGPHVRGYTHREARIFVSHGGCFRVLRAVGVGFYPLPARLASPLARLWVSASHTPVLVARREPVADASPWLTTVRAPGEVAAQTFYAGT